MSDKELAIVVKDVKKSFKIPLDGSAGVKQHVTNFYKRKKGYRTFTALNGISFEINKGDFFGVVGRNGSGKSTLLKMLAGVYRPDSGDIGVYGSLTPFIELGVGFNPELTGRENVYLNGALLGFSNKQMDKMYEEIVDFAELHDFMEERLKNYSSGMQIRLAFSIAIRANTDILLLDEILAVGDEAFQRKCFQYFKELKRNKKTVILVTHSMEHVRKYCNRAVLIRDGRVVIDGSPEDVANQYTEDSFQTDHAKEEKNKEATGLSEQIPYFKVTPESKQVLSRKDELIFNIEYEITDNTPVRVFFSILDEKRGGAILQNGATVAGGRGRHKLTYVFPLRDYNDTDMLVNAAIDQVKDKKRLAFTNSDNSCRFAVRNKETNNGLIGSDSELRGHWVGYEEYMYNLKEL